jgi:WD repeat-containing protein 42A
LWRRESGTLHGIYEGDGSVVNVIEAHPTLPLIAVSGIDHEPKVIPPLARFSSPGLTSLLVI